MPLGILDVNGLGDGVENSLDSIQTHLQSLGPQLEGVERPP